MKQESVSEALYSLIREEGYTTKDQTEILVNLILQKFDVTFSLTFVPPLPTYEVFNK